MSCYRLSGGGGSEPGVDTACHLTGVLLRVFTLLQGSGDEEEEPDAFDVSLAKNAHGLGITIAGYVADKNLGESSGHKVCRRVDAPSRRPVILCVCCR